ncbi:hypothetical protein [Chondromyces crocatus]|uniref:Keratin associated protein n=1 Tax=Chondromyces crocatus TaxID=52 RepID=A0A0K1EHS3_CHOCO|nr:hypothetical protein [Chondromyces crocatus]AKT40232.1 uncharacterized protein CMC5_043850 [Chondromyces crocatus]
MSVNRWKLVTMPVLMLGLASPLLVNCGSLPALPGPLGDVAAAAGGCPEMETGSFADLKFQGGAAVEGKVKGFLEAAFTLDKVVTEMEASLIASCGQLGKDLGMSEEELKVEPGGGKGAEKLCSAVAAKVTAMLQANAEAQIAVEVDPPKCYVPIDFMTSCLGDCGSPVSPGKLEASCKGGEIAGTCEAECKGSCNVEAGAACNGTCKASCEGKCEAGFSGTCGGKCDGKCDGKNTKGKCAGKCEGKCDAEAQGTCSGTCDGKCSGSCEMKASAKCDGTCSGGCSAEVKAPKCTGDFEPPNVDISCQMQCTAKGAAEFTCDAPNVRVVAKGKANTDVNKLIAALQTTLPAIVKIQLGTGKKLATTVAGVVKSGAEIKDVALKAGGKAIACIAVAVEASASASASIDVNVKASASVGGSVGTGG